MLPADSAAMSPEAAGRIPPPVPLPVPVPVPAPARPVPACAALDTGCDDDAAVADPEVLLQATSEPASTKVETPSESTRENRWERRTGTGGKAVMIDSFMWG